jgi:Carboxypeptidase Taq (M32) metallopeptidase
MRDVSLPTTSTGSVRSGGRRGMPLSSSRHALRFGTALFLLLTACSHASRVSVQAVEPLYQDVRSWKDDIDVTRARGQIRTLRGAPLTDLAARYNEGRGRLRDALASTWADPRLPQETRALDAMRRALDEELEEERSPAPALYGSAVSLDCAPDPPRQADPASALKELSERTYACFGRAAQDLTVDGETLDRVTILSLLAVTDDDARRQRLFRALAPVWTSIDGDRSPASSPYRQLVRLSAAKLAAGHGAIEASAAELGIEPGLVESWLTAALEGWHRISPDEPIEPWDFAYRAGAASRALAPAIPRDALRAVNDRFYRDLGADVTALSIHYDLEPRQGKSPLAFTAFGARPRHADGAWVPGEPWVFASFQVGGVDNLNELLHESGHAVHMAALCTRPAFMDWPDNDMFSEALADVPALELFEPEWQRRYLGVAVPLGDAIRAKYAGIVMDTAWALFELRMHRDPSADPNGVWAEITERYLRIRPHAELSWWAVRGQLISMPGYMLTYAIGAIVAADLRARVKELHGPFAEGDPTWYAWMSDRIYRFGLERPSRQVLEDVLGRPVSPRAFLDDLARAGPAP